MDSALNGQMPSTFLVVSFSVIFFFFVLICKVLQQDSLDVLGGFSSLLHTVQELKKLDSKPLLQWPTYSSTLQSFTEERDTVLFQQQIVKKIDEAKHYFSMHCEEYYCTTVSRCLRNRLEWTDS